MNTAKTILITGCSSGIGKATAIKFAQDKNVKLILAARREQHLNELQQHINQSFKAKCLTLPLDVSNTSDTIEKLNHLPHDWKNIDVLVNNAGVALGLEPIQESNIDDWQKMIDTNITGLFAITHAILPGMIARNNGHIINLSSIAAHEVYPGGAVYCATKSAVKAFSKGLMMDLNNTNIRVTTIDPGMVNTEFSTVRFKGDKKTADKIYQGMTPLSAQDIADAIYYCSSRPAHVNISEMIILPTDQASTTLINHKKD